VVLGFLLAAHRLIGKRSLLGASDHNDEKPEADDLEDDIIAPEEA